jgi:hypothetical protein
MQKGEKTVEKQFTFAEPGIYETSIKELVIKPTKSGNVVEIIVNKEGLLNKEGNLSDIKITVGFCNDTTDKKGITGFVNSYNALKLLAVKAGGCDTEGQDALQEKIIDLIGCPESAEEVDELLKFKPLLEGKSLILK